MDAAAQELVELTQPLLSLYPGREPVPLVLAGGNLDPGRGLRGPVLARLQQVPRIMVREAGLDPAEGALAIARKTEPG